MTKLAILVRQVISSERVAGSKTPLTNAARAYQYYGNGVVIASDADIDHLARLAAADYQGNAWEQAYYAAKETRLVYAPDCEAIVEAEVILRNPTFDAMAADAKETAEDAVQRSHAG